jgi:hypothetical protein
MWLIYEPESTDSWWDRHKDAILLVAVGLILFGAIAWGIAFP